jgi:subtilisin family serine protease
MLKNLFILLITLTTAFAQSGRYPLGKYDSSNLNGLYSNWGLAPKSGKAAINLKKTWKAFTKKKDIVVAVIDTGIDPNHPHIKNNLYAVDGKAGKSNYGVDFSTKRPTTKPNDTHGHGTHVSGIIKSIFPEVKLLVLKYYNPQASGQENLNSTIKALEYAVDNNVDIINYSGGGPEPSIEELKVLRKAEAKGILIVAAAGNERSNIDDKRHAYYPASYGLDNIISVSAHDKSIKIIPSSNWGRLSVDLAAPGHHIKSSIPGGKAGYMTGTSQATAFVTGIAAIIKSNYPELTYEQVKNSIIASSKKIGSLSGKTLAGGKLDAFGALRMAQRVDNFSKENGRALAKKK